MAKEYILKEGGLHQRFFESRAKIQFFGGGYGNGKTSAMIVKALNLSSQYPGMQGLIARSTYPKLNDTIRVTFEDFCPPEWIDSFPRGRNSDNAATLINGSRFNFRYIAQKKGTDDGGKTSNLLSATYDLVVVDQIEDPEITYKDFLDLLGRMRGNTLYRGDDPTMPRTGPRWMFISANPTRNWVYTKIIAPVIRYKKDSVILDDLLCERDDNGKPILIDGKPILMIEIFEGSTYENAHVLEADFIRTLESAYRGQMKDRFLKGLWVAYEGLVYPMFDQSIHMIEHHRIVTYLNDIRSQGYKVKWRASYDFGIASPSCFLLSFVDPYGNVFGIDGYYEKELSIETQVLKINKLYRKYQAEECFIYADPDIFRKKASGGKTVGKSVEELFMEEDSSLRFTRGNNDIKNGILKVSSYLNSYRFHRNPIDGSYNQPYLYFSADLKFLEDEITSYNWQENKHGEKDDMPVDRNDHAMDSLKYLLSEAPEPSKISLQALNQNKHLSEWTEQDTPQQRANSHRYR